MSVLVDREPEINKLRDVLKKAASGSCCSALVVGDSGTGKSFLLDYVLQNEEAANPDLVIACGSGEPVTGRTTNLRPIREIVGHLTGLGESRTAAVRSTTDQARLDAVHATMLSNLVREAPELLEVFALRHPSTDELQSAGLEISEIQDWLRTSAARPLDAKSVEPGELFRRMSHLLKGNSNNLIALVIDDLQWVDAASLELLLGLPRELAHQRIAIFATAMTGGDTVDKVAGDRSINDIITFLGRNPHNAIIDLNRTRRDRGRKFCEDFVAMQGLAASKADIESLWDSTGANALAVRDVVIALQQSLAGSTREHPPKHRLPAIDWSLFSQKHVDILNQRLAQLDSVSTQLLETAAVEGQEFTVEVLAKVHNLDKLRVLELLDKHLRLQHRLVDDLSSASPDTDEPDIPNVSHFRFEHGFYRKHIYETRIAPSRRKELHKRIANELQDLWQGHGIEKIAGQLAHHFHLAGEPGLAVKYYALDAENNASLANYDAAALGVDEGLRLAPYQRMSDQSDLRTLFEIGTRTARARGLFSKAEQLARQALSSRKIASSPRTKIRLQSELARSLYNQDIKFEEAEGLLRSAISSASKKRPDPALPDLHRQLGITFQRQGRYADALREYLTSLDVVRTETSDIAVADTINSVGVSYALTGFFEFSVECQETALTIAAEVRNNSRDTLYLNDVAAPLRRLGRLQAALDASTRSETLGAAQGKWGAVARAIYERAQIHRVREEWTSYGSRLANILDYDSELLGQGPTLARARAELLLLSQRFPNASYIKPVPLSAIEADAIRLSGTTEIHSPDLVYSTCTASTAERFSIRNRLLDFVNRAEQQAGVNSCWSWPFLIGLALLAASRCENEQVSDLLYARGVGVFKDADARFGTPGVWKDVDFLGHAVASAFQFPWPILEVDTHRTVAHPPDLSKMIPEFRKRFVQFFKGKRESLY